MAPPKDSTGPVLNLDLTGLLGGEESRTKRAMDLLPALQGEGALTAGNIGAGALQSQLLAQLLAQSQNGAPLAALRDQIEGAAGQNLLGYTQGRGAPTPEVMALINSIYDPIQSRAQQDLERMARNAAAARGMAISDSPIGNEYLRQGVDLLSLFGGQRAQAALGQANTQAQANMHLQQLQANLRNQALQSRLSMVNANPGAFGLQQQLYSQRFNASPVTQTGNATNRRIGGQGGSGEILGPIYHLGKDLIGTFGPPIAKGIGNLFDNFSMPSSGGWSSGGSDFTGLSGVEYQG